MSKPVTCAIYARVSTVDQNCEMQLTDLRGYAKRMDWTALEYVETASGKAGAKRPVQQRLLADARLRKFDVVLVWKIDRFGRSLIDMVENIRLLDQAGIRFIVPGQGIDTDNKSPIGKVIMHIMAIFAELERDLIVERVSAGSARYRADYAAGKIGIARHSRSGKNLAPHRPRKIFDRAQMFKLRKRGLSLRAIAAKLQVPLSTVAGALKG